MKQHLYQLIGTFFAAALLLISAYIGKNFVERVNAQSVSVTTNKNTNNLTDRVKLRSLLQEHSLVAGLALLNRFDNTPDADISEQIAQKNSDAIVQQIGTMFGTNFQNQFSPIWQNHMSLLMWYANAAKNNDQNLRNRANSGLTDVENSFADLFSRNNDDLSKNQLLTLIQQHIDQEKAVIDAHASNDFNTQYIQMQQAYDQAGTLADYLSTNKDRSDNDND